MKAQRKYVKPPRRNDIDTRIITKTLLRREGLTVQTVLMGRKNSKENKFLQIDFNGSMELFPVSPVIFRVLDEKNVPVLNAILRAKGVMK